MQTPDQPRLAVVDDLRRTIADLVLRAREHDDRLGKIEAALRRDVIWRAVEREQRAKRTKDGNINSSAPPPRIFGPGYPRRSPGRSSGYSMGRARRRRRWPIA